MNTSTTELLPVPGMPLKDLQRHDRARRAFDEARKLRRTWQGIARTLSRNPNLQLELAHDKSATNGTKIYIKVPMELGDNKKHNGSCGQRNHNYIQVCPRCAVLEDVNITVIHEVAHIVGETFEKVSPDDLANIVFRAIETECNNKPNSIRAKKLLKQIETAPGWKKQDYLNLADLVNPYLPLLINACEDIRVNALMQQNRPGTRPMFIAQTNKIFDTGICQADGTYKKWLDCPPNAQALIGVYCMTWDIDLTGKILPEIADKLTDIELQELVNEMRSCTSVREIYRLSFPLLEVLRRLGFMKSPDDPEDDEEANDEEANNEEANDDSSDSTEGNESAESDSCGGGGPSESMGTGPSEEGDSSEVPDPDKNNDIQSEAEHSGSDEGSDDSQDLSESDEGSNSDFEDEAVRLDTSSESENGKESAGNSEEDSGLGEDEFENNEEVTGSESEPATVDQEMTMDGQDLAVQTGSPGSPDEANPSPNLSDKDTGEYTFEQMESDGLPEVVKELFVIFGRHEEKQPSIEDRKDEQALKIAILQVDFFDRPSLEVKGTNVYTYTESVGAWRKEFRDWHPSSQEVKVPERILTPALHRLRLIFTDNARGKIETNLKSGKVNARVLAKRLPIKDDRVFLKKRLPGKKDYFVLIGLDCSGSTCWSIGDGIRLDLMKTAAYAKAELLNRLGINFAVYAHSGNDHFVEIFTVKDPKEPWGPKQKEALCKLNPYSANLDGHTLEFYRKVIQKQPQQKKLLLYYTDGAMPAENYAEELIILQSEIDTCRKLGIHLVGVGVNSDSPKEHGLDTILLDTIEDIPKVVQELGKRIEV